MKRKCVLGALAALMLVAADGDAEAELKKLEGDWQVVREELVGRLTARAVVEKLRIVIEDDQFTWYLDSPRVLQTATVKVDPTADPRTIDAEVTRGAHFGKKMLGIYKLDKDTLEICWSAPGKDKRPTKFTTKPGVGAGYSCTIYKREKDK
jgi:uncharacterized protein (TIGR03067 family)